MPKKTPRVSGQAVSETSSDPQEPTALPPGSASSGDQKVAASTVKTALKFAQDVAALTAEDAAYRFIRQSDDSTESPASAQDVMVAAFLSLGKSIAPGGETALTARKFAETLSELLRTIGKNDAFQERFEALLEKRKSGTLTDTEQQDYDSFCLLDDSCSGFIRQLRVRSGTE